MDNGQKTHQNGNGTGGQGGLPPSITPSRGDTRLVGQALKQRWPIPEEYRQALIDRQVAIAIDPKGNPRNAASAFKAILAAEAQNQADELAAKQGGQLTVAPIMIPIVVKSHDEVVELNELKRRLTQQDG